MNFLGIALETTWFEYSNTRNDSQLWPQLFHNRFDDFVTAAPNT